MPDLYCLLDEPLISVRAAPGAVQEHLTLPEVLGRLWAGQVESYCSIQAHQRHAWHAFLVQVAAMSLAECSDESAASESAFWRRRLLDLSRGSESAWTLVVDRLAEPAFMQPPVPEGKIEALKNILSTPDEIDVLLTAKNHDVKGARISAAAPEHWVFALVSLQTMQGFLGAGNYGIARMNGGFASRPCVAISPALDPTTRFRRDVALLREKRQAVCADVGYAVEAGRSLLWLEPWDGSGSLEIAECDPWFVEVCRRVRLEFAQNRVQARSVSTKAPRLNAKLRNGVTGDPWTPTNKAKASALTVASGGFRYRLVQELLFGIEYADSLAQTEVPEGKCEFVGWALVRGQGRTDGLHERVLPIPPRIRPYLGLRTPDNPVGTRARTQVEDAGVVQLSVLRPSILVLLQGAPGRLDLTDERGRVWTTRLDQEVDRRFFPSLWDGLDRSEVEARRDWQREVLGMAWRIFGRACREAPIPAARAYKVVAAAERVFTGAARKRFPDVDRWRGSWNQ